LMVLPGYHYVRRHHDAGQDKNQASTNF